MRKYFADCVVDTDEGFGLDEWLEGTNYPDYRKQELKREFEDCGDPFHPRHREVKVHGKDESYSKFAEARGIYSRTDIFKCISGPFFAKISKKFFIKPCFFKKVPNHLRIYHLKERMSTPGIGWDTDFTSFESTFQKEQFELEYEFYRYCCGNNPKAHEILDTIEHTLRGINICKNKFFKFRILGRRMSGEMNTSLGNSYFNLLVSVFIAVKSGNTIEEVMASIIIEGDDCLCKTPIVPDVNLYEKVGAKVKQNYYDDPSHASFCGMIFDMDAQQIIVDPIEKVLNVAFTNDTYLNSSRTVHNGLLKAKAMSMLYSYPGCPIIGNYCNWIMKNVVDYDARYILKTGLSEYELEKWNDILKNPVPFEEPKLATRILMEQKFNISIDTQIRLEKFFDSKLTLEPWSNSEFLDLCKPEHKLYYDIYGQYNQNLPQHKLREMFI
jgi:hypothetical protein